jgi:hypothetical protein
MLYALYASTIEKGEFDGSLTFREFLCYGHVAHVVYERRVHATPALEVKLALETWTPPVPCDGSCKERYVTRCPNMPEGVHAACVGML